VPQRITVTALLVRRLIEEQLPQWAGLWLPSSRCPFPCRWRRASPARITRLVVGLSMAPWLDGEPASADRIADPSGSQLIWPGS
jgi:hypothetical protein